MSPAIVIAGTLAIIAVACLVAMTLTYVLEVRREDARDREESRRRAEFVRALGADRPLRWTDGGAS